MEEKKGFNFLVGIFSLWGLYKLYTLGVLHVIGFLAVNKLTGTDLTYSSDLMTVTPIGIAISFIIELITLVGYLSILVSTGLWNLIVVLSGQVNDLFKTLLIYLKDYTSKTKTEPKPDVTTSPVDPNINDSVVLYEIIRTLKARLEAIEGKVNVGS